MVTENTDKTLAVVPSEGSSYKKITIEELNNLGYELTGRQMPLSENMRKSAYWLLEVKNEDSKQEVRFCYLYSNCEDRGVILPETYSFYVSRYQKNRKKK